MRSLPAAHVCLRLLLWSFAAGLGGSLNGAPIAEAKLPYASPRGDNGLGFPRVSNRLPSTGTVRFAVIFVDFSDAVATRSPESVFALISPEAEKLFAAMSYGRLSVALQPTFRWLRMRKPSTGYGWPALSFQAHHAYIHEALRLAESAGVNFAASDSFVVLANPEAAALVNGPAFTARYGDGVRVKGKVLDSGATSGRDLPWWGYKWFNHEIGHALALPDLYAYAGEAHRFVGEFSLMGLISGRAPEYFAWERWNLGWLDDEQVWCADRGTSERVLTPLQTAGGLKMVVVPTGRTSAVVVEHRAALGYDAQLPRGGPLVYAIDTAIASGLGVVKVLTARASSRDPIEAPLVVGEEIRHEGVVIRYLAHEENGARIEITRP